MAYAAEWSAPPGGQEGASRDGESPDLRTTLVDSLLPGIYAPAYDGSESVLPEDGDSESRVRCNDAALVPVATGWLRSAAVPAQENDHCRMPAEDKATDREVCL